MGNSFVYSSDMGSLDMETEELPAKVTSPVKSLIDLTNVPPTPGSLAISLSTYSFVAYLDKSRVPPGCKALLICSVTQTFVA